MIYFVTFMVSTSVTTAVILLFLIVVAYKEQYALSWIYGLIKSGLIFLLLPLFVTAFLFAYGILMSKTDIDIVGDMVLYSGRYVLLTKFYPFTFYGWILFGIWIGGVLIHLGNIWIDIFRFKSNVLIHNKSVIDENILKTIDRLKQDLSINESISVFYNERIRVPVVIKMKNTMIVLGDGDLTQEELTFILTHELMHLKRKHIFFKALSIVVKSVYWFNPFTYYFVEFFSDYCELDCDREVLKNATAKQRLCYAETYLKMLSENIYRNPVIQSSFIDSKKKRIVDRRIRNMMYPEVKKSHIKRFIVSVLYVFLFFSVIYGATKGGLELQYQLIHSYDNSYTEEEKMAPYFVEEKQDIVRNQVNYVLLDTRLGKNVDEWIEPGCSLAVSVIPFCPSLRVNLMSTSDSANFRVEAGDQWGMSIDGMFFYMFCMEEDEMGIVYIDNLTDERIQVTGVMGP